MEKQTNKQHRLLICNSNKNKMHKSSKHTEDVDIIDEDADHTLLRNFSAQSQHDAAAMRFLCFFVSGSVCVSLRTVVTDHMTAALTSSFSISALIDVIGIGGE